MLTTYAPEMDSLIVDLDKVLDDFEAEEKASSHFPGQELKPSDFANYVAEKEDRPWEDLNKAPFSSDPSWKLYSTNDKLSSIDYDVPYSPAEDFDLSEADFAPSVITNQNNLYKDTHRQENFVSKEVNNHVTLNHNGVVENSQSIYENNRFIGNDKTALLNEKVFEHDVQNLEVKNGHDIPERIVHGGSEFNGTYTQHNKTGQLPNSDSTDAVLNNAKSINRPVLLLANYTDETGCKFPIQARDEFTPVYENQPFPPDLAPALQNSETQPSQLYQIPESFSETFVKNDLSDTEKTLDENHIGNHSALSLPPTASANLYLKSNDSSIDSGMNSMEGQHGASFDTPFVNSSQSQPSILHKNETEIPVDNMYSNSSNEATPQPDKMTNKDGCLSDSNQDNLKDQQSEDNQVTTPHTSDVMCEETEVKSLTDSQTTPPGDDTRGDVVGFGDFDVEVSDKDLDSYLSEVVLEDSNKTMTTEYKENVEDRDIEQMSSLTCVHGAPQLNQMRESSELSYVQNPDMSYIQSPDVSYVQSSEMSYVQSSEMSYVQSSDQSQTPVEQAQTNQHNSSPGGDVELFHDTATKGDVQNEMLGEVRSKESVQPNSLSQPSASFVDSSVSSDLSLQTNDTDMDGNYTDQLINEKTFKSDSNEDIDMSNTTLDYLPHSAIQVQSRQAYNSDDDDDMDEDLRAAIALSLKETTMSSNMEVSDGTCAAHMSDNVDMCEDEEDIPVMRRTQPDPNSSAQSSEGIRPHSWGPSGSGTASVQQQKRPNSLNLPPRGEFSLNSERSQAPYTFPYTTTEEQKLTDDSSESTENTIVPEVVEGTMASQTGDSQEASGASGNTPSPDASLPESAPQPLHHINTTLGKVAPLWIPDAEASVCMGCDSRFTFTKRRHHCRACGKVFCSSCCNLKSRLQYMENKEARVCHSCHEELTIVEISSRTGRSPNPNNPSEYCSTIPPTQQVSAQSPPPTVMVPVGVLKREGSHRRGEPKQVMFSDGIRPGGDLTELDGSNEATSRIPHRRSGRSQKKVDRASSEAGSHPVARRLKAADSQRTKCLIPENGLPPLVLPGSGNGEFVLEENPDIEKLMPQIKNEDAEPVIFALNTNLQALVKILSLDCCVNRLCWCFTSKGMCTVGQDEIVIVLETLPEEMTIPKDIFCHLHTIYEEAGKGNTVSDMGHTIFNQSFLDSRDHGGFLYIRPTFQCLHKLILPTPPYVFGILLQKWETPWAKVFPIRLLLRLGAEYRYYPCPLISVRNRKPVFFEIGHTIMNLLADFRNFQYMLPQIKGITIHMEDKKTVINFPRNRYDDLMKVVSNSNEHVMAIGAGFSTEADSHLVCIQNDDGNYQTQAINIQNKPRKVTGASFVVFNGALKTSSGLKAKSSIVEDGLMVQISPESMVALKQAMKDMKEYSIGCGSITLPTPDEVVVVQWVREDKNINIGVKSPIDNMAMDGIESIHIPNATDYVGEHRVIRWTDVFFIQNLDSGSNKWEPVDLSRLAETLSNASCIALSQHLDKLKEESLIKIGLRVNIETDKVGYEIGANGDKLPDQYMNDLDNELIPVIHSAASQNHGGSISLELIFHILD